MIGRSNTQDNPLNISKSVRVVLSLKYNMHIAAKG